LRKVKKNFSLLPLRATTFAIAIIRRAITLERAIKKKSKELLPKREQIIFKAITLQGAIEKNRLLLSQYLKNE